jgi:hypothetical protein
MKNSIRQLFLFDLKILHTYERYIVDAGCIDVQWLDIVFLTSRVFKLFRVYTITN